MEEVSFIIFIFQVSLGHFWKFFKYMFQKNNQVPQKLQLEFLLGFNEFVDEFWKNKYLFFPPLKKISFFSPFIYFLIFIVIQLQLYAFSPHPSTPPQLNPPPSPTSTLPLGFVHVSLYPLQQHGWNWRALC